MDYFRQTNYGKYKINLTMFTMTLHHNIGYITYIGI